MSCQTTADCFPRQSAKIARFSIMLLVWIFILLASVKAVLAETPKPSLQAGAAIEQARQYKLQFRKGDTSVVTPWVEMLELATQAEPENADLWFALGYVYLASASLALQPGGNPADAMALMQKGPAALRQALKINPNHAQALSQIGGLQTLLGPVLKLPAMAPRGVAQMNRAIELAPESITVRLMRAFAGPNLPPELRNTANEVEDLDYLIQVSEWGAAGDYMRIMRADLDYESGKPELARALYRTVEGSGTRASGDARSRLAALDAGGVSMADIRALRSAAGAQCAMCHAP